ncbi:monovalent cation/H+ antiporter subunit D family protein [Rhizobium ruizarguesonis]|uniref:Monovalent cation/H+ antiporter subunit D family protein n=3 Tax=Rhizobium ruizarguesonis TaxID=2081791 RepID=A0ABY1XCT1_9HYPH|nr:monovalent cation/H+ antiporter subunit D family protein [Rhizobium ruizarguesonis]TAU27941.1 monovalent cation/H+ antiporter subunit D family protein [Rhizobium ruizarguesonis]TAU69756.1 monovalent cation/H+ antiporter subunit D family protein [Rhizobium ruizarguesonis]TAU77685.1 monovalent cation/H+ antiporter subunit D family protein [Rhizobium ruizarguesonis]TAV07114.1 monovalent cation/H+ antiporter subunit D family protein [Rhizobium ruizarguesonis]TAV29701.1 monovalent cation/H+ anti
MDPVVSIRPLLAVTVAGLAALAVLLLNKRERLRDLVSPLAAIAMFAIVVSMAPTVLAGGTVELRLFEILPGIDFAFRVDALGMVFATVSSLLWIVAAIYSVGYMRHLNEHAQTRFFACFASSLAAAAGGAFAANLFTLVIFYEVLSLVTYPLVYHHEDEEGWRGSRKYLVYLMGASKSALLAALALTYHIAGSLDFVAGGLLAGSDASAALLTVVYFCYLFGFAKAAVMPMHAWLPAAMVAPTPVSALLHAVAVVKMGVFCVLRVVFHVFGTGLVGGLGLGIVTAYLASFTILMASVYALTRDDLKARLAYSTVSQLSYIVLGAVLLSPVAMVGGIIHIAAHAFSKITLFFCAGSIYCASGKRNISDMAGVGRRLPWTMGAFFVASLSMIGVPPTAGFVSKWYLALGSLEAGEIAFLIVLLVSSVLNAAYFLPVSYAAFFGTEEQESSATVREIPMMTIPLVVTALLSVLMGIFPGYFLALAEGVVR